MTYKENRKGISERRQEKPRATLYRKMLISWSSGFGFSNFFISNQRQLGNLYCERKISEFGDAELEIQGKP